MSDVPTKSPVGATPSAETLFRGYAPPEHTFDEVFSKPGDVRPGWRQLLGLLEVIGADELTRRWSRAQEEVRQNGVTYNAYEDGTELQRPWELDALPLLIDAKQWTALSAGLVQRAELLNRILADLYGPQELLQSRLLPAEWLFNHPGFQRRFHGQRPEKDRYLHLYAADLARTADGRWWVVGDRTDAPLGLGYALENRLASSRMLPNAIRECHVERLAHFFMTLQQTLRELAPRHRENPRIVLLSHGPSGPSYFEDAYLARYLGCTLVEGGDMAVRDDHVYLKTLSGLLPVDVILRRLSDQYCDPLEVRAGKYLGVPGLLQAVQLGNVAIANAFGTSLVESPSLLPFLPGISRHWLRQDLLLPSLATWWCGQREAREQVAERQNHLVFRSAYRVARQESPPAEQLWAKSPTEMSAMIERRPSDLVGQEAITRSTAPVWVNGRPEPRHVALRVFLVADKGSYRVLPGGLVRMGHKSHSLDLSILAGEVSKDAWVLSAGPVAHASLLPTSRQPTILRRSGADVPSRVADNLFWFGRRIERAQGSCRLLRPVVASLTGEDDSEDTPELPMLVRCLAANGLVEPGFALETMKTVLPTIAQALPPAVLDARQSGSLRATFDQAYTNALLVRDRLSLDSWRVVHRIQRKLIRAAESVHRGPTDSNGGSTGEPQFELVELDELLDELIVDFAALDGLFGESMTRTHAWRFLELGRRLERALQTISLIQSLLAMKSLSQPKILEAILKVADSLMTYRGRYLAAVHLASALDLLLTDETNPRSLAFQLMAIADHVANLPRGESKPLGTPEDRITSSLVHSIRMLDVEDLSAKHSGADLSKLERTLLRIADQLPKLSELVSHRYLIHGGRPQQMGNRR